MNIQKRPIYTPKRRVSKIDFREHHYSTDFWEILHPSIPEKRLIVTRKRPMNMQKRPISTPKRPIVTWQETSCDTKETYEYTKETYLHTKETHCDTKETHSDTKETFCDTRDLLIYKRDQERAIYIPKRRVSKICFREHRPYGQKLHPSGECFGWYVLALSVRKRIFLKTKKADQKHCENWWRESGSEFHKASPMCKRGEWWQQLRDFIAQSLKQSPLGSGTISSIFWPNG